MRSQSLFAGEELLINLKKIAAVSVSPDYQKIIIAYADYKNSKICHFMLTRDKVNYTELIRFIENCLPTISTNKITFIQLDQLHESLLQLYFVLAKVN